MTKTDLVNYVAEEAGMSKADATRAVDAVMSGITQGLKDEKKVTLTGFCTFTAKDKPASSKNCSYSKNWIKIKRCFKLIFS